MQSTLPWPPPPPTLTLARDEVHVWKADLDASALQYSAIPQALSPDERERAAQFRFPRERERFAAGRGILRHILARYLHRRPAEIAFGYGRWGKPALAGDGGNDLRFNLAHAGGLALYAVTRGRAVGIDVERAEMRGDWVEVAPSVVSPNETRALLALPQEERMAAFFTIWTRKEAFLKARGDGLSMPLDWLDALGDSDTVGLDPAAAEGEAMAYWRVRSFGLEGGYAAAVAVEGRELALSSWGWGARAWDAMDAPALSA
jgi:4'-phosphopantetheinyl transferase